MGKFYYMTEEYITGMKSYKYKCTDDSPFSKYIMQPYWNYMIRFIPMWMAPNLVTLLGFIALIINFFVTAYYTSSFTGAAPNWVYLVGGLCIFFYQTMDNLDGRQARRTDSSSPLGQLFDHGCDVLAITICGISTCAAGQLGPSWYTFVQLWMCTANFWFSTWEEFHTNVLYLGFINGPTEGIVLIVFVHILTFFVGADVWQLPYKQILGLQELTFLPDLSCAKIFVLLTLPPLALTCLNSINVAWKATKETKTFGIALHQLGIFAIFTITWVVYYTFARDIWIEYPRLLFMTVGIAFGELTLRLILAHLCGNQLLNMIQRPHISLLLAASYAVLNFYFKWESIVGEVVLLIFVLITWISFIHWIYNVNNELCQIRNIKTFVITPKKD